MFSLEDFLQILRGANRHGAGVTSTCSLPIWDRPLSCGSERRTAIYIARADGSIHSPCDTLSLQRGTKPRALTLARTCYFSILERAWGAATHHAISLLIEIELWD